MTTCRRGQETWRDGDGVKHAEDAIDIERRTLVEQISECTLSTTNPIEFLNGVSEDKPQRRTMGRRRNGPSLARRLPRRGFEDSKTFRRLRGYSRMRGTSRL